jgi:acyl-[acyl carrier protein]--UDP-N-acetylglucosamine O-acyltransferase
MDKEIKISLSVSKNTFIIGHYNAADFSILSGFDEIKQQLSIVSKSFLTMAKPIKINNTNIYIRDTILLAPGGQKSLAGLGKLYEKEGDFNKRQLTQKEYENMRGVLENDKQLFEDYALQDVIITLKHAIAMEKFNFTVKKLGIPVTLSSIGRNYVTSE